jgi:hypothetical protein
VLELCRVDYLRAKSPCCFAVIQNRLSDFLLVFVPFR